MFLFLKVNLNGLKRIMLNENEYNISNNLHLMLDKFYFLLIRYDLLLLTTNKINNLINKIFSY
jgi:hypothetical protein